MVVITDSTFLEWAPKLRQSLFNCDFIAIDFEFLGLDTSSISLHDTTEARYSILRENVIKYRPCQLGLSFFKQAHEKYYLADCYSIPLLQRFGKADTKISIPSLRFLAKHGFNFNQVFSDGVEFCTRNEYEAFKKSLEDGNSSSFVSKEIQLIIEMFKASIHEKCYQLQGINVSQSTEEPMQTLPLTLNSKSSITLRLPEGLCSTEINIIINELVRAFPQFFIEKDDEKNVLNIKNLPDYMNASDNLRKSRERCAESFEGISAILEVAGVMRKLIVGHNSLLDAMYLYHYFFARLPVKYHNFKKKFNELFPKVIDTKILAQILRLELPGVGDSLEKLGEYFGTDKSNCTVPPELRGYIGPWMNPLDDDSENTYHNAGFDSYITGEVFLKLAHVYINGRNKLKNEMIDFKRMLQYLELPVQNRLPFQLMDTGCCFLTGEDSKGCRPDIISVVKRDGKPFGDEEFQNEERILGTLMNTYQFDIELTKDRFEILLATNTPGSYAFLCEKFSKNQVLAPRDELESGQTWTFEQRQTAWRSYKDAGLGVVECISRRWSRRQIARMEEKFQC